MTEVVGNECYVETRLLACLLFGIDLSIALD